ncbi:arsenic resistance protein [Luteimonas aestuarii]|uniref:Arsenic resistance protein n=1 Tax=Luteimonas aestuarii TaxID=453837 RepID=A0A4V3ALI6_9GAMM|nr:arsenic resistance protein [Luteimonas aestuarii]TDK23191.1 arsenic resistance protein [Luteimonas aestuarii]
MTRQHLERHQLGCYLAAIAIGLLLGRHAAAAAAIADGLLMPLLGLLLLATFSQVSLLQLRGALADTRFCAAVVVGNFVLVPLLAWALARWLPLPPPARLGLLLVLLVPCTDWFITFTQLGRGDAARAIAVTPLNLLLQLLLLPLYLWWMHDPAHPLPALHVAPLLLVLALPLALAIAMELALPHSPQLRAARYRLGAWPVPLLALVLMAVAATLGPALEDAVALLPLLVPAFAGYLLLSAVLARALARAFALPAPHGRTLAFSLGTRNSFVVLPLALALPAGWELAAAAIVTQTLVELLGMLAWLRWMPRLLR